MPLLGKLCNGLLMVQGLTLTLIDAFDEMCLACLVVWFMRVESETAFGSSIKQIGLATSGTQFLGRGICASFRATPKSQDDGTQKSRNSLPHCSY